MFSWDTTGIHEDLTTVYVPNGNNTWHPIIIEIGFLAMQVDLGRITFDNASEWEARATIAEQVGDAPTWTFTVERLPEEPVRAGEIVWLDDSTLEVGDNKNRVMVPAGYYRAVDDGNSRRYSLIWTRHVFERYAGYACNVTPKTRPAFMKRVAGWLLDGKTPAGREKVDLNRDFVSKNRALSIAKNVEEVPA